MGLWSLIAQVFRGSGSGDVPNASRVRPGAWFLAPGVVRQARITEGGSVAWVDPGTIADGSVAPSKLAVSSGTPGQVLAVNEAGTAVGFRTVASGPEVSTDAPVNCGGVAAIGTSPKYATADHRHSGTINDPTFTSGSFGSVLAVTGGKVSLGYTDAADTVVPSISRPSGRVVISNGTASVRVTSSIATDHSVVQWSLDEAPTNPVSPSHVIYEDGAFTLHLTGDPGGTHGVRARFVIFN